MFSKNLGYEDRILRLVVSLILFGLAWYWGSWIVLLAALFTLFEAAFSWCAFYQLTGKNTCPLKDRDDNHDPK